MLVFVLWCMFMKGCSFVFGGSEGIGLAIAEALVANGEEVVIVSRSPDKLRAAQHKILVNTGKTTKIHSLDISDYQATVSTINTLIECYGTPERVFNCAGFCRPDYFPDSDPMHFQQMLQLNVMGTVHVCKAIEPHMRRAGGGHIINTSSIAGFIPLFGYTGYSASKYAVKGFSRALRTELKPYNIKVSLLCPPNTKTPGLDTENQFKPAVVLRTEEKLIPMEPEDVAKVVINKLSGNPWLIIPGTDGWIAYWLNRLSTRLIDWIVRRPANSLPESSV